MATTTITIKLEPSEYSTLKLALDAYIKDCDDNRRVGGGSDRTAWARQMQAAELLRKKL